MSSNEGTSWKQIKNGFPSVSTMDLVIQEKESALVIGTFGRALWVIDDLISLRAIIAHKSKDKLIPLPLNDIVQVKGLFIAPPGNIWSGFHTTFEGENRAFQKAEIPFFINEAISPLDSIAAVIKNNKGSVINTLIKRKLTHGLNYISWKLDENSTLLPGLWVNEESRGIPVLPGEYTAELSYKNEIKSIPINVISDPRFEIEQEVDQTLYSYQKSVEEQVQRLAKLLKNLERLEKITQNVEITDLPVLFLNGLKTVQLSGRDKPLNRQVGAWQSDKITPHSVLKNAINFSKARLTIPSTQDWLLIKQGKQLVDDFEKEVNQFYADWKKEIALLNSREIN
jgi:hypothetical protein